MSHMNQRESLQAALEWRYAAKSFDSARKISDEDWQVIANSLILTPSSYGLQPWKFLVVQNSELRAKLKTVSWNQRQVTECSHYVVLLYKEQIDETYVQSYIDRIAEVRGVSLESLQGFYRAMVEDVVKGSRAKTLTPWLQRQVYIAMGFALQAAAHLRIDACPIEGLDPAAYDDVLGLQGSGYKTIASIAFGYRRSGDQFADSKKVRFPIDQIIEFRN